MRQVIEDGLNLIKRFEGFSHNVYTCSAGYPSIGYGHVVLAHEREQFAVGITQTEVTELLRKRVRSRAAADLGATDGRAVRCAGLFHFQPRCWGVTAFDTEAEGEPWRARRHPR